MCVYVWMGVRTFAGGTGWAKLQIREILVISSVNFLIFPELWLKKGREGGWPRHSVYDAGLGMVSTGTGAAKL